ncbi:hypothetical protein [Legionella micdadei]|uniref:Uncharacterized protein n=1 Tax=Legionella micdadei TaxID=451 RepID=A0A098GC72_LEGMI|nr:hypothetical protein [Legionella micdadei]ARG96363.1 hypothetical protein B6N58_00940 [Legionella micdadei]ARG99113.1 hypothetical protein B6V88_00935 [Legionella micdadei]KTD29553.1 hypothetical protein Lmic_0625 [Legionella micdadei]NSL18050.1 hypothetical protein [Legionella micdadei]CEG59565.1 conserved exported protein of unknown function [Legionella micdadei]
MKQLIGLMGLLLTTSTMAAILDTDHYRVVITCLSQDHEVGCERVSYEGTNKDTGATIRLVGRQVMQPCADKTTPCHSLGYEFSNGSTYYFVSEDGHLKVIDGSKVLINEYGEWTYE